jgi:hypothetical protein
VKPVFKAHGFQHKTKKHHQLLLIVAFNFVLAPLLPGTQCCVFHDTQQCIVDKEHGSVTANGAVRCPVCSRKCDETLSNFNFKSNLRRYTKVVEAVNALMPTVDFGGGPEIGISFASQFAAAVYKIIMRKPSHEHWLNYIRAWVEKEKAEKAAATTSGNNAPAAAAPAATTTGGDGDAATAGGDFAMGCMACTSVKVCAACAEAF